MAAILKPKIDMTELNRKLGLLKNSGYGTYSALEHTAIFFASRAYARMKAHAPTPDAIRAAAEKGIRLRKNRNLLQEIAARIRAIGVSSYGYMYPSNKGGKAGAWRSRFSRFDFNLRGVRPTITHTNMAPGAAEVLARFPDVMDGAVSETINDIEEKHRRWALRAAKRAGFLKG